MLCPLVGIEHLTPSEASANCDMMYVMTIPNNYDNACTAIIPTYENYHVQKWMRQDKMNFMECI